MSKMPNYGKGGGNSSKGSPTNTGSSTGLKMTNEGTPGITKPPSNKNPYPKGLC